MEDLWLRLDLKKEASMFECIVLLWKMTEKTEKKSSPLLEHQNTLGWRANSNKKLKKNNFRLM